MKQPIQPPRTAPERVMLLWCPDWPVIAAIRTHGLKPDARIALIESGRVYACSATARAEGVKRGLKLREAQARCPDLIVQPYRADEDARAFEPVLTAIEEAMPGVQPLRPGVCAIRSRGPAQFYGSEEEAALWLLDHVDALGVPASRVGIADGVFTAEQAARGPQPQRIRIVPTGDAAAFLAPLPVGILDDLALTGLLRRLGVYTLGEFAALPAELVLDRFGDPGARLHSLAGGRDSRPVIARVPPDELDASIDFEPPLDRVDQVAFGVRATADAFIHSLTEAKLVCTAVLVRARVSERRTLRAQLAAPALVHRRRRRRPGALAAAGRQHRDRALRAGGARAARPGGGRRDRQPRGRAVGVRPGRAHPPRALPRAEHARPHCGAHPGDRRRSHPGRPADAGPVGRPGAARAREPDRPWPGACPPPPRPPCSSRRTL